MIATTTSSDTMFFALPDHGVLMLRGRDAVAFAQAQAMNDVGALADGQWQWNGWLTPKGRVIALFALLRRDSETLWLLLPDADAHALADGLRRFVFRSKVAIEVRDDLRVAGRFAAPARASGHSAASVGDSDGVQGEGAELDFGGDGGARTLRLATADSAEGGDALARWRSFDLQHGLPRLDATQHERWTPQQLSLDRLRAFSVKKGCYPGQEIVARTHFLGQAKRGLVLLRTAAPARSGAEVRQAGSVIGEVVSAADAPMPLALAVLPHDAGDTFEIDAKAATKDALLGGLER